MQLAEHIPGAASGLRETGAGEGREPCRGRRQHRLRQEHHAFFHTFRFRFPGTEANCSGKGGDEARPEDEADAGGDQDDQEVGDRLEVPGADPVLHDWPL